MYEIGSSHDESLGKGEKEEAFEVRFQIGVEVSGFPSLGSGLIL